MKAVRLAYECYADGDVLEFLRRQCGLPLDGVHARSQGNVINLVMKRQATLGMVDEDPGRPHHRDRDAMPVVSTSAHVEWRRQGDRHLIIVKPELEPCVLRTFKVVQLKSSLPAMPADLHRLLTTPHPRKHEIFRQELAEAHRIAREQTLATFTTEIERVVRAILAA